MAYCFTTKDKSATKALCRIARERFAASADLAASDLGPQVEVIHELRKNVKKVRALLRLVRPNFTAYGAENAALRDAGRMISALRDADVLAATFDKVAARTDLPPDRLAAIRASLIRPQPPASTPGATPAPRPSAALAAHARAIAEIDRRARKWQLESSGFGAFEEGLERSWMAAQKAMRAAASAPTGDALHLWRKRVKDHWYHARLIEPVWPAMMAHHIAVAETLGETLGDARDLAFLAEALAALAEAGPLCAIAREEEDRLLAEARALGRRFLSEPAEGLARRWRGWWEIWTKD